ncbi:MAG: flagellar basal body P-ring formation chaperone FlgA [Steroidobacteraceae bacterium]
MKNRIESPAALGATGTAMLVLACVAAHAAPPSQDPATVAAAARTAASDVARELNLAGPPAADVTRLPRLAGCPVPLHADAGPVRPGVNRLSVRVECDGPPSWRVWVPVALAIREPMVVARRDLARDALLTAADVEVVERVPDGPGRWVRDPGELVGRRLGEPVAAGTPLQSGATRADRLVVRGQQVTISTAVGSLAVTARGIAQSDGGLGARIRVRSLSSNRVVEGIVRSSEVVEVLFPGAGSG